MRFFTIIGARPQFIKAAALSRKLRQAHQEILLHTGQHYDASMSDIFFQDLDLPSPDYVLHVGSDFHGAQTAAMLSQIESALLKEKPDAVIVYGDTNTTLAGALAAAKLHIPVAHIEAGLRSYNRQMPEEINRVVADHVAFWLFAPSESARETLKKEGLVQRVYVVGDIMLDALSASRTKAEKISLILKTLSIAPKQYFLATIHRAENTDNLHKLTDLMTALGKAEKPVIFPLHPRTKKKLHEYRISIPKNIQCLDPIGFLDMIQLQTNASLILTDSGGVQKEAYYLHVPCVTLREETEWVETVATGWNKVAGTQVERILQAIHSFHTRPTVHPDLYGDGTTADKILQILTSDPSQDPREAVCAL